MNNFSPEYARLHELGVKCLRESKSPYGFKDIPMHTKEERRAEYLRMLNFTRKHRQYPGYKWAGYAGPWIEELWIQTFCCDHDMDEFGPYVPLFVPWVNIYKIHNKSWCNVSYPDYIRPLFQALRPDFLYITVNANDYGMEGMRCVNMDVPNNILIISASGRGHIPILLHAAPREWTEPLPKENLIVFLGKMKRGKRVRVVKHWKRYFLPNITLLRKADNWTEYYRSHSFVLSPRGNARGCFRTAEILEMGLIPIMAFYEQRWVPYLNSTLPWDDIAIHAVNSEVPDLVEVLNSIPEERIALMRQNVRKYKHTHFTMNATINQIRMFMKSGYDESDLRCGEYYDET